MKRLIAIFALFSGSLWAQSSPALDVPASRSNGPSYSQMYCSGFITRQAIPRTNYVVTSKEAPHQDQFDGRSILFLGGPGLAEGQRYSILRQVEDPDREDSSPEQRKRLGKLGKLYQEVGWATVHSVQKGTAIASFDFTCDVTVPGDIVVPFHEKPQLQYRTVDSSVNSFREASGGPTGRILGSKEFVGLLGSGVIVYTDFGSAKGAQPGDYLFIRRGYADSDLNRVDRLSEKLPTGVDVNAVNQPKVKTENKQLPSRLLGEMLVLNVSAESSTALITRSFAEIQLGDAVENEDTPRASGGDVTSAGKPVENCSLLSRARRVLFLGHGCGGK